MTGKPPFSRPFPLHRVTGTGSDATVEADAAERAALADDLGLPSIARLEGRFRIAGSRDRVVVTGRVAAEVEQTCGVTLEPFPVAIDEPVELTFAAPDPRLPRETVDDIELSLDHDPPDEITGDAIDLGAVAAEFLALTLDPFPRRPGVAFEPPADDAGADSPFARLRELRGRDGKP